MTTLMVRDRGSEAKQFLNYARTLPFVDVLDEKSDKPEKKLKPSVEAGIRKSMRGEGLTYHDSVDDMLKSMGY